MNFKPIKLSLPQRSSILTVSLRITAGYSDPIDLLNYIDGRCTLPIHTQSDSGRKVNIFGIDSIGQCEYKKTYERATEIKLFESPDQWFPGDPWIRFRNSYFEVYSFFSLKE
jgi:hypothetical protein